MVQRCARALVVALLATGSVVLLPQSSTAAPALVLSRTSVIAGETITVSGTVGGRVSRPAVLQRRNGTTWIKVKTTRTRSQGAFRFGYRPPVTGPAQTRVRVLAPAVTVNGRRLPAIATAGRFLTRVTPTARITAPAESVSPETFSVAGAFFPVRPGRGTEVQRWTGTTWSTVAVGKQDATGSTRFEVGLVTAGTQRLRTRAVPSLGAPANASAAREIVVLTPEQDTRAPKPPTGVAAAPGDRSIRLSWDPSAASNLRGRHLYVAGSLNGPWARLTGEPVEAGATSYDVRGLSNGVPYVFGVSALYDRTAGIVESTAGFTELVVPTAPAEDTGPEGDACGPLLLKEDGSAWRCTLGDDFDGTTFDRTHWFPQQTFASGTVASFACYGNTPETISVGEGVLSLSVVRLPAPVSCSFGKLGGSTDVLAGSLMTYQRFTQRYGRFEARIKSQATTLPGLQEAFWMWPDDRLPSTDIWPVAGEIDVSETYSSIPGLTVPFLHYRADAGGPQPGLNTAYCAAPRGEWNTYTLIWSATRIEIRVNGETCLVNTSADPAFAKPYLLALTAMLGNGANAFDGRVPLPATMQVDYVRVWE